jgi:hypothetical protein
MIKKANFDLWVLPGRIVPHLIIKPARQEPAHTKHVDGGAEGAVTEAVFALAETTRTMIHWNLNQPISRSFHQCGDETVHALEWNQRPDAIPSHRL